MGRVLLYDRIIGKGGFTYPLRACGPPPPEGEEGRAFLPPPLGADDLAERGQVGATVSAFPRAVSQYITGVATRLSRVLVIRPPMMAMARGE